MDTTDFQNLKCQYFIHLYGMPFHFLSCLHFWQQSKSPWIVGVIDNLIKEYIFSLFCEFYFELLVSLLQMLSKIPCEIRRPIVKEMQLIYEGQFCILLLCWISLISYGVFLFVSEDSTLSHWDAVLAIFTST